jgi:hypothetical protein
MRANQLLRDLGYGERVGTDTVPNYPSRKWMAGYFDADGHIGAVLTMSKARAAAVRFTIAAHADLLAGVNLVQKAFGGEVVSTHRQGKSWGWALRPDAAKAISVFEHFAQYLLIKKEQAYFVLTLARRDSHFRDGKAIVDTLHTMKSHPHRLNDLGVEVDVTEAISKVRDIQTTRLWSRHTGQVCIECGNPKIKAKHMCVACYHKLRYHSIPSVRADAIKRAVENKQLRRMRQSELA